MQVSVLRAASEDLYHLPSIVGWENMFTSDGYIFKVQDIKSCI